MINIIVVVCCIMAGFAVGKYIEHRICEKGKFYQDLTMYIALLKDNVSGRQVEMSAFNSEFAQKSSKAFSDYLLHKELKLRLNKAQKDNLSAFFDNLDCVSSQALLEHIGYHGKILADDSQKVIQNEVAKSSVYGKLGMLLGAMLGILIV